VGRSDDAKWDASRLTIELIEVPLNYYRCAGRDKARPCGWKHPWRGPTTMKSRECLACQAYGLVGPPPEPAGHIDGNPFNKTLAMFSEFEFLKDLGLSFEDCLERIGVKKDTFLQTCRRWPNHAPELHLEQRNRMTGPRVKPRGGES
jgi:hypothetical protein